MKKGFLIDMDGVLHRRGEVIDGAPEFLGELHKRNIPFVLLTNNSRHTGRDVAMKLNRMGIPIDETNVFTSAMATAQFLASQKPNGTAYVLGEGGLVLSLHNYGYSVVEQDADYVIVGEGRSLTLEMVEKAIDLIIDGAKLIATNLDPAPLIKGWTKPGTGAIVAMLEEATGTKAFSVGKPSPVMMRAARKSVGLETGGTYVLGDTMQTDVLGGVQMGYKTILVLTGWSKEEDLPRYAYRPDYIFSSIADIDLDLLFGE